MSIIDRINKKDLKRVIGILGLEYNRIRKFKHYNRNYTFYLPRVKDPEGTCDMENLIINKINPTWIPATKKEYYCIIKDGKYLKGDRYIGDIDLMSYETYKRNYIDGEHILKLITLFKVEYRNYINKKKEDR